MLGAERETAYGGTLAIAALSAGHEGLCAEPAQCCDRRGHASCMTPRDRATARCTRGLARHHALHARIRAAWC
ncbi:hypothetical protein CERSUDRAFT_69731 [Gelatoporia subvermispora B]|uniref:Uncharacterized protein n=1 Tax=Ceriporiopsis subvermispora (strain B) TaxID=914234 RepID=M2P649_CERS8|nr:hypothetical protein CERSUDRAFT_69731 [Gelatoporia subvermispora B]